DVPGNDGVSHRGQNAGEHAHVDVATPTLVHDQDTGAFALDGIVPGDVAGDADAVDVVGDFLADHFRAGGAGEVREGERGSARDGVSDDSHGGAPVRVGVDRTIRGRPGCSDSRVRTASRQSLADRKSVV